MNNSISIYEKRLLIFFLLKDRLCQDIIQMICMVCDKYDLFYIKRKIELINDIKNTNKFTRSSFAGGQYEISPSLNIFKFNSKNVPLLHNHSNNCGCDVCLSYYDNSRYITLFNRIKHPYSGPNSKEVNRWIFFQYCLSTSKRWTREIRGVDDIYGFTSIYDKTNNFKIDHTKYINSHILLRNNKNYIVKLKDIWSKINN